MSRLVENEVESHLKKSFFIFLWIGLAAILFGVLLGYFIFKKYPNYDFFNNHSMNLDNRYDDSSNQEIQNLRILLEQKERELETLLATRDIRVVSEDSIIKSEFPIRFSIKPKKEIIAECFSMEIGKWKIPKGCLLSLATKIHEELERDYKVVAFEVQGIVDTNPYRGLSSELKQEGLASFRAKEAIREINSKFSNTAVFEGASIQIPDKRGYRIKAYFYNDF